tara:strand:+ start:3021 stop:3251 length:231 start_codon:yes stop_codon:yes gene_type:complete
MTLEQSLQFLQHNEHFAVFIGVIHSLREEAIAELHNADYETQQQISGRILTYDQILQMSDWQSIRKKHNDYFDGLV